MRTSIWKSRSVLLQGLYGLLLGSLIPLFLTLSLLVNNHLVPNWHNWWLVHLHNGSFLLVDIVPILVSVMLAKIAADSQALEEKQREYEQTKMELDEEFSKWRLLSEHSPVGYVIIDRELNVVFANRAAGLLVGMSHQRMLGNKCYECRHKRIVCPGCPVVKAFVTRQTETNLKTEVNSAGEECFLEQVAVPMIKNGQVEEVLEIVVDVTDRVHFMEYRHEELLATIDTLVGIIELNDGYTGGHSQRVRRWAVGIARSLNLSEKEISDIDIAACLHDIGKIGITGGILNKPGDLTKTEYDLVKQHPIVGSETLSGISRLGEVGTIIRHHHEAFGGFGYPDGLRGEEIPIGSRIICVADAFDAMTTDRVYRKALTKEEALLEIKRGAGVQFDPRVVESFMKLISNRKTTKFASLPGKNH